MFTNNKILSTDLSTSIPQRRSIFAIFVHFGESAVTNAAVASLQAGTECPDYIIIVDHTDAVIPGLTRDPRRPGFRLTGRNDNVVIVRPEVNTGYAGGLVVGLNRASELGAKETDLCILLNNDIRFTQDSLQQVVSWWEQHGGPQVLSGAEGGYVSLCSGRAHIARTQRKAPFWSTPYIHGSCMVGEFGLFASLSFPTSFFLYWEDVLISMLVHKQSGTLAIIPTLGVIHDDSPAPVSPTKLFYMVRNGAYVLERHTALLWRVYWYGMNTIRMAFHTLLRNKRHKIVARALYAARLGKLGKADV